MVIQLPWPPSINHYYIRTSKGVIINKKGREYRKHVYYSCLEHQGLFTDIDRLRLFIIAHPPDKKRRDLDNLLKVVQDSLQFAKVFPDDSQIDELSIRRSGSRFGMIEVTVEKI